MDGQRWRTTQRLALILLAPTHFRARQLYVVRKATRVDTVVSQFASLFGVIEQINWSFHSCIVASNTKSFEMAESATEVKLFGKWSLDDVEIADISLVVSQNM